MRDYNGLRGGAATRGRSGRVASRHGATAEQSGMTSSALAVLETRGPAVSWDADDDDDDNGGSRRGGSWGAAAAAVVRDSLGSVTGAGFGPRTPRRAAAAKAPPDADDREDADAARSATVAVIEYLRSTAAPTSDGASLRSRFAGAPAEGSVTAAAATSGSRSRALAPHRQSQREALRRRRFEQRRAPTTTTTTMTTGPVVHPRLPFSASPPLLSRGGRARRVGELAFDVCETLANGGKLASRGGAPDRGELGAELEALGALPLEQRERPGCEDVGAAFSTLGLSFSGTLRVLFAFKGDSATG
eukprot:CAMPEP_0185695864 /NCGR_PEP_ID=MMETSP1164-20130828/4783_1 /TAXON_ID=1104430 /ORGANISM="Chrysoreinhardia sp, Strain CCMP2950" /LENGTH=302 /DNA_ID=CAMNT_0028362735 /DNA_START=95 /DNA_END=1003 /DNA_ORIENTATION=-